MHAAGKTRAGQRERESLPVGIGGNPDKAGLNRVRATRRRLHLVDALMSRYADVQRLRI